jgi:hypothetical protein
MSTTEKFTEDPGQELFAIPASWTPETFESLPKVACTELFSGSYRVTLDYSTHDEWWIYIGDGETAPSSADDVIGVFSVDRTDEVIAAIEDVAATGTVTVVSPVDSTGKINGAIVIGDDYLAANSRAFTWTIPAITGVTAGTATARFGGAKEGESWLVVGTITVSGSNWVLSFDLPRTETEDLTEGYYAWSVKVYSASGTEITRVRSNTNPVQLVRGQA